MWPLLPVAFAVLCELICRSKSMWRALLIGWAFGFGQFVVGLNWIATAFTFQSNMPAWLGWVAVVLLSLYLAVYPALATGLAWRFGREDRVVLVMVLGGAWAITEWLRGTMFTGFPWNPAAAALAPTPLITITALIGTYGLSGLVVLLGGAIWLEYHKKWLPLVVILGVTALAVAASLLAGPAPTRWRSSTSASSSPTSARRTSGARASTRRPRAASPRCPARRPASRGCCCGPKRRSPTRSRTRAPTSIRPSPQFERTRAASLLGPNDRLLTGGIAIASHDGVHVDGAANSIFALAPGGKVIGRYDKAHLVPYGEYLPMRPLLSAIGLSRLAPGDLDFTSGPGPRTIDLGGQWGKVGFQLCYEIIFSGQVVDEKNRPAFIFNPSNDAWFGRWGPPQHLAQARLRAAEEGLPVLRSTPTGISAVIDAPRQRREVAPVAHGRRDRRRPPAGRQLAAAVRAVRQCRSRCCSASC